MGKNREEECPPCLLELGPWLLLLSELQANTTFSSFSSAMKPSKNNEGESSQKKLRFRFCGTRTEDMVACVVPYSKGQWNETLQAGSDSSWLIYGSFCVQCWQTSHALAWNGVFGSPDDGFLLFPTLFFANDDTYALFCF